MCVRMMLCIVAMVISISVDSVHATTEIVQNISKEDMDRDHLMIAQWSAPNFDRTVDVDIPFAMAVIVQDADIIILRKINPGPSGIKATASMVGAMNNRKTRWDYIINDQAEKSVERFAVIYRIGKVKIDKEQVKKSMSGTKTCAVGMIPCRIGQKELILLHAFSGQIFRSWKSNSVQNMDMFDRMLNVGDLSKKSVIMVGDLSSLSRDTVQIVDNASGFVRHIDDLSDKGGRRGGKGLVRGPENIWSRGVTAHRAKLGDFTLYFNDENRARVIGDHLITCMEFSL